MADFFRKTCLENYSHENKEKPEACQSDYPGKSMLFKARNKGQGRSEENSGAHGQMNPALVSVLGDGRKK